LPSTPDTTLNADKLAETIADLALSKKAAKIQLIDVRGLTSITDFFLICSADTEVQVKAISDAIRRGTPSKPWRVEGYEHLRWILMDYIDVVAHVFTTSERDYYNLERLWADAPIKEILDEPARPSTAQTD
jgi:ribosome-associated protein